MPYLTLHDRKKFVDLESHLAMTTIETPGELNYLITRLLLKTMKEKVLTYTLLNGIIGAVESSKAEFQRRVVNPYEDTKRISNGDVY